MPAGWRSWVIEARISDAEEWREVATHKGDVMAAHEAARAYIAKHGGMSRVRDPASGGISGQFQRYGLRTWLMRRRR